MWFDGERVMVHTGTAVARWDLATGQREVLFSWANESHNLGQGVPSRDGEHVVIPSTDGAMELRGRTGPSIVLRGHRRMITHVEFTRDGRAVFSSSDDGTLRRWDVATGTGTIVIEDPAVHGFVVARDGRVAVQAGDRTYLISAGGAVTRLGEGSAWCVGYAEFEPVTDRLVIRRCDRSLAIVDGAGVTELPTDGYMANRVVVSPDGRRIAGGVSDRTVRLWDAASGQVIDILHGHGDSVLDVAFSPDGRELASASYDKTIWIWDLASKRHRVLRGHTASVEHVAWRGADQLVTGSLDGTIRLWDVPSLEVPSAFDIVQRLNAATTARIELDRPASGDRSARGT
jgi:WD40 repeat protein